MGNLQDIQNLFSFSLSAGQIAGNIAVALICGLLIARTYCWTNGRPNASRTFVSSCW